MEHPILFLDLVQGFFKTHIPPHITYSWFIAIGYAILDERDKALDWLENAVKWGLINYPLLSKYDPFLKKMHTEERFQKLMDKVKSEWEEFEI